MIFNPIDSRWLYNMMDYTSRLMQPYADITSFWSDSLLDLSETLYVPNLNSASTNHETPHSQYALRYAAASLQLVHTLIDIYEKPAFGIEEVQVNGENVMVTERAVQRKSFCNLVHFKKVGVEPGPIMLIVAPMSGHYATLLRETVRELLPYYDVYITDWKNARDVPLSKGSFDLDEFSSYLVSFMQFLGPQTNAVAVCQPTVPIIMALSLMASENDKKMPRTVTLIGGPIDTNQMPTSVNMLADTRRIGWFQEHVISTVPRRYPGAMRMVYPGFMQLSGFMSMNLERHLKSLWGAVDNFAQGKVHEAYKTKLFYLEYFSVMDLTAEFYIQTLHSIFKEKLLSKGKLQSRGHPIRPQDITNTAILAIEGAHDDIVGVGQTKAILELCKNVPAHKKQYHLQEDVGHYGLFSGSKFRNNIVPIIRTFTKANEKVKKKIILPAAESGSSNKPTV